MVKPFVSGFGIRDNRGDSIEGGAYYGIFATQSIEGGGSLGAFDSQSIEGGGSVSGVSVTFGVGGSPQPYVALGFYFRVSVLPSSTSMILHDLNAGTNGYYRSILRSDGHVIIEARYATVGNAVDICPSAAVVPGVWYWVSSQFGGSGQNPPFNKLRGQITKGDGTQQGLQNTGYYGVSNIGNGAVTAVLGMGVSLSNGAGYLNFPKSVGNNLSKLQLGQLNAPFGDGNEAALYNAPAADQSASGFFAYYTCRDVLGTTSGIVDSTANHYDLSPGPNGLLVVADGPYP